MTAPNTDNSGALGLTRTLLRFLRPLNLLYGVGISIMFVASLTAPVFLFRALHIQTTPWSAESISLRAIMIIGIIGAVLVHQLLTRLLRIIESVRSGDPFILENADNLKAIARLMLIGQVLHLVVGVLIRASSTATQQIDFDWKFSIAPWVSILLVYILARVFEHGARLREDVEATI